MNDLVNNPTNIPQLQHGYYEMTFLDPHPANFGLIGEVSTASLVAAAKAYSTIFPQNKLAIAAAQAVLEIGYAAGNAVINDPPVTRPCASIKPWTITRTTPISRFLPSRC